MKYKREPNENSRLKDSIWSEKKYTRCAEQTVEEGINWT